MLPKLKKENNLGFYACLMKQKRPKVDLIFFPYSGIRPPSFFCSGEINIHTAKLVFFLVILQILMSVFCKVIILLTILIGLKKIRQLLER